MQGKTNSSILRAKLSIFGRSLDEAYRQLWAQPDPARHYTAFLIQLHQIIRAIVPLMETAKRRSAALAGEDRVCALLVDYFDRHIEEERDHDKWVLNDLTAAGVSRIDVLSRAPSPSVAALVGAQYYWIEHHHPVSLLSYIALLEEPPSLDFLADLEKRTGLPGAAFRTMRDHGELDPGHRDDFDRFMDTLPLTAPHHEMLGISAVHSMSTLEDCVRELHSATAPS